ncbi:MAG: PEGA domain-containing protein [Myxococcales bacterium]
MIALLACSSSAFAQETAPGKVRFDTAEAAFAEGDFELALSELRAAASLAKDDALLTEIHLLRGRCYAALGDTNRADEAFTSALEFDPEARLDPAKVRPAVVAILDGLRERLKAELSIRSSHSGALIFFDGKTIGVTPLRTSVPIGKHEVEVRTPDGALWKKQQVTIRARQTHELYVPLQEQAPELVPEPVEEAPKVFGLDEEKPRVDPASMQAAAEQDDAVRRVRFFADLRAAAEPMVDPVSVGGAFGVGVGGRDLLASVHGSYDGQDFGASLRVTARVSKLLWVVGLHAAIEAPAVFLDSGFGLGAGVAGGLDFAITRWLELFLEGSYRRYFLLPDPGPGAAGFPEEHVITSAGLRIWVP